MILLALDAKAYPHPAKWIGITTFPVTVKLILTALEVACSCSLCINQDNWMACINVLRLRLYPCVRARGQTAKATSWRRGFSEFRCEGRS